MGLGPSVGISTSIFSQQELLKCHYFRGVQEAGSFEGEEIL
jgi:hypothetical protein